MPPLLATVHAYRPEDLPALHDICVRTADAGRDSRHLYPDPDLMPSIFAAPYAALEPELTFVLDDGRGRARAFYDRLGFHEIAVPDPGPLTYLGRSTSLDGG
ncbi:hypothetical protein [Streptomyces scopuliridis]|uniref:hypothetical protein n=1 Tax=Streptomyces scopuliridis TaxID=452529 RepID=UPI0036941811